MFFLQCHQFNYLTFDTTDKLSIICLINFGCSSQFELKERESIDKQNQAIGENKWKSSRQANGI